MYKKGYKCVTFCLLTPCIIDMFSLCCTLFFYTCWYQKWDHRSSLTKSLLSWLLSLNGQSALERALGVPNFHLQLIEATVLKAAVFLNPFPDLCLRKILSQKSTVFWPSAWCSLICTVNSGAIYRKGMPLSHWIWITIL